MPSKSIAPTIPLNEDGVITVLLASALQLADDSAGVVMNTDHSDQNGSGRVALLNGWPTHGDELKGPVALNGFGGIVEARDIGAG